MTAYWAILAAWLAAPGSAHECLVPDLAPKAAGELFGHLYFDRRLAPLPEADVQALKARYPDCPDATHFLDTAGGDCLTNEVVRRFLADGRRGRLARTLDALSGHQKTYQSRRLSGRRPAWTAAEAQAVLGLIRTNQDILPADVVERYEGWLSGDGYAIGSRVKLPANVFGTGLVEDLSSSFAHAGAGFVAPRQHGDARTRQLEAVVDNLTSFDPKTNRQYAYSPEVKRLLRFIVRYAEPKDAEAAIALLSRHQPPIAADVNEMFPGQYGVMQSDLDDKTGTRRYSIKYGLGVLKAGDEYFRLGSKEYRDLVGRDPDLSPYRGAAPQRVVRHGAYVEEVYSDATIFKYSEPELAASLLHEILHIGTRERKAGAVVPISEEASRQAEMRILANYADRVGRTPDKFLSPGRSKDYLRWKHDEAGYRAELKELLDAPLGYNVEAEARTPQALEAKLRSQLALTGAEFTAAKARELAKIVEPQVERLKDELEALRRVGAIDAADLRRASAALERDRREALTTKAPTDDEWRKHLQDSLSRIPGDRRLGVELDIEDSLWRQRYRFSLPLP